MASNVGSLVISLEANLAKFQSDLGKAAAMAEQRAAQMDKAFGIVKNSLATLGLGFAFGATLDKVKDKIEGAIQAAAGLQQLSERTGATVEALSGLAAVARLSGTGTDQMAVGLQKLSKAMIDAENGGKKTSASFEAIGISTKDLEGKKPDQVFQIVSKALAGYQDGAEKVVIAQNLLGKAGADLLPVMKDLADVGELQVKVTAEQAAMADELEKNQVRLQASTDAIFKKIGLELVPVYDAFVKAMLDAANANDGVRKSVDDLAKDGSIREWAEDAAKVVGFVIDAFDGVSRVIQIAGKSLGATAAAAMAVVHGNFSEAVTIQTQLFSDIDGILSKPLFSDRLQKQLDAMHKAAGAHGAPTPRKRIDTTGLGNQNAYNGPKDDPARAYMEGQIKAQEALIAAEKTQLQTREQYLDFYRTHDLLTLRAVEEQKQQLIADNLVTTQAAYDKEIAAIQAYIAHADRLQDKQQAANQLADVVKKRAAAEVDANKQIVDSQMKLLAVRLQFDNATAEAQRQADKSNAQKRFDISMLGQDTLAVQQQVAARQIQLALDERIYQLKKLDPTVDTSKAIADAAIQQAQASALIAEAYDKQRDAIFGAQEALRKYQEEAGNKAAQIESAMTNAFKGMEDALVTFVTTGKLSFKGLVDSIVADITRMVIKEQMSKVLSSLGGSSGGGFMGLLGSLFGAGAGAGAGGLASATAADVASAGPGLMFFANGGVPPLNVPSIVGENGPELFVPRQSGTIIPNSALRGDGAGAQPIVVNNHFTIQGAMDRRTQQQIAASAAQGANRALARNL